VRLRILILAALVPAVVAAADPAAEADALYAAGEYLRAAAFYTELDDRGEADGPVLYKLFFCQRQTGDPAATATLSRATARLATDAETSKRLETHFYLVNAYSSAGRTAEAAEAARRATSLLERTDLPAPADWEGMFRVGKLYADQGEADEATAWYRRSLTAHAAAAAEPSPYIPWARRYIVDRASARGDLAAAEEQLAALTSAAPTADDLDHLAVLRVRLGRFAAAVEAWQQAERLNPADANRARYCWRLSRLAEELGSLPPSAPDGREWGALSREELETMMKTQAEEVGAAVAAAVAAAVDGHPAAEPVLQELQRLADAAKPLFVAAGLEYAVRGLPIRQTAFFGGYAPLIFKAEEWDVRESARRRITAGR